MRKTVALLSAFALAFTLTSCGSDDKAGGNASNTGNTGNTDNTGLVAANIADLNKSVAEKTENSSVHMTLSGTAAGQEIEGEGDMRFGATADDFAMSMDISTPDGDMTMLLIDKVIYMKLPEGQELQPGKPWLKIDSEGTDPMSKMMKTLFDQMAKNADPKASLELFSQAGEITETEENVEINGENTTHYTITVDVAKLAEAQTDPTIKQAMEQLVESGGMTDFPVEMWVNDESLPARFKLNMPAQDPTTGETMTTEMQVDYTDWGKEVTVEAPPADETVDAAEAMNPPTGS
jgi:hypothetical protein